MQHLRREKRMICLLDDVAKKLSVSSAGSHGDKMRHSGDIFLGRRFHSVVYAYELSLCLAWRDPLGRRV